MFSADKCENYFDKILTQKLYFKERVVLLEATSLGRHHPFRISIIAVRSKFKYLYCTGVGDRAATRLMVERILLSTTLLAM